VRSHGGPWERGVQIRRQFGGLGIGYSSMKIYTRTGDQGTTGLFGGHRVSKSDLRIKAYGSVDELNAVLGVVRSEGLPPEVDKIVLRLQSELFQLGAQLASPDPEKSGTRALTESDVGILENEIDTLEKGLPSLKAFILPGGTKGAAQLHVARCVCRRAERELVALAAQAAISATMLKYVNRVSDLLFVLARVANKTASMDETEW